MLSSSIELNKYSLKMRLWVKGATSGLPTNHNPILRIPSCNALSLTHWCLELGMNTELVTDVVPSSCLFPPLFTQLLLLLPCSGNTGPWAEPSTCMSRSQKVITHGTPKKMVTSTLPSNCWWLSRLSDKSYDNISSLLAQRWFGKHISIEGKNHNFWCWLQCPSLANGLYDRR